MKPILPQCYDIRWGDHRSVAFTFKRTATPSKSAFDDTGYIDAETIAESRLRYQVDIVGPVMPDTSWAAKEAGRFVHSQFLLIDWQAKCVRCPAGHMSHDWGHIPDRHGKPTLRVRFPLAQCRSCSLHDQCTPVAAKVLILRLDEASYNALVAARKREITPEFRHLYARRAGIEGTIAQAVRVVSQDSRVWHNSGEG